MASGDHQDTSPSPKPTGKKAKKLSQKEQSERFIETARELGADAKETDFGAVVEKIVKPRRPQKSR